MPITIMLVDDHNLFREGLKAILQTDPDISVVGEAGDGDGVVGLYDQLRPDVVLMDICMKGKDGVAATIELLERHPDAKVIILSAYDFSEQVAASVRAGARGFLPKDVDSDALFVGIKAVAHGGIAMDPVRFRAIAARPVEEPRAKGQSKLSEREIEVLRLVARGLTNREVAQELVISPSTAKSHIASVMDKLGLHSRVELTAYMFTHGTK